MTVNNVGIRIKALRNERGYTLKDMHVKTGISISFLSDIENGRSKPSLERLNDIAKALDTTTSFLMGEENIEIRSERKTELTPKDEKDVEKLLNKTMDYIESQEGIMLNGEILDDQDIELLKQAIKNGLEYAKISNKKKYTPKKYRK